MFKNLVLISFISLPLASENLLDIYNEALDNDPQYKSSGEAELENRNPMLRSTDQDPGSAAVTRWVFMGL